MKIKKYLPILLISAVVHANDTADDTITINRIFFTTDGSVAVETTQSSIPNASANRDCLPNASWDAKWAGVSAETSDRIVSALLSAHAQGRTVKFRTDGCLGAWHQITSVYIN